MKTIIRRTSQWGENKPCEEAVLEQLTYLDYRTAPTLEEAKRCGWYNEWFNQGENHREENGMVVCDHIEKHDIWTIEFDDVFFLCEKYAPVVIEPSQYKEYEWQIEIYDSYRE